MTKKNQPTVTAKQIVDLLALKHHEHLFVSECPIGPNWGSNSYGQIDALAIKRSWAHPEVWGYEVKISRADWLQDKKWEAKYLPPCSRFTVVTPPGVLQPEELPQGVGLMHVSKTGTRLYTKRKAPLREVDQVAQHTLLWAIMINRAAIKAGNNRSAVLTRAQRMAEWRQMIEDRTQLGYLTRRAMGDELRRLTNEALEKRLEAEAERDALLGFKKELEALGIDPGVGRFRVRGEIRRLLGEMPPHLERAVVAARRNLELFEKLVKEIRAQDTTGAR